jgi:hypothetical protein
MALVPEFNKKRHILPEELFPMPQPVQGKNWPGECLFPLQCGCKIAKKPIRLFEYANKSTGC